MPEHLRALLVILAVAGTTFTLARAPLCHSIFSRAAYARDCWLWIAATLIAFLSHDFWIYIVLTGGLLLVRAAGSENPLATYCLLLFVAPPFQMKVSVPGLIEDIFMINHYRLLALAILLPMALRLSTTSRRSGDRLTDLCMGSLLVWTALIRIANDTPTGTARGLFYLSIDYWLPYYVASRSLATLQQYQRVAAALALSAVIVSLLAVFENQRLWLLYASLGHPWGVPEQMPMYLSRGENGGGILRSLVSLGHPIALGYTLLIALLMTCGIHTALQPPSKRALAYGALSAGLVASMSRGPWVGAGVGLVTFLATGRNAVKRISTLIAISGFGFAALLISPFADRVADYLPFIGTVDAGNIDYRGRLIEVSLDVISQNPITGDFNFANDPNLEEMRQGEGIIDVVNTYLQVALPFGIVGLLLFVGIFLSALRAAWKTRRAATDLKVERLGSALCACIVGILVTNSTVSSIFAIPTLNWLIVGMCVGYARVFRAERAEDRPAIDVSRAKLA